MHNGVAYEYINRLAGKRSWQLSPHDHLMIIMPSLRTTYQNPQLRQSLHLLMRFNTRIACEHWCGSFVCAYFTLRLIIVCHNCWPFNTLLTRHLIIWSEQLCASKQCGGLVDLRAYRKMLTMTFSPTNYPYEPALYIRESRFVTYLRYEFDALIGLGQRSYQFNTKQEIEKQKSSRLLVKSYSRNSPGASTHTYTSRPLGVAILINLLKS